HHTNRPPVSDTPDGSGTWARSELYGNAYQSLSEVTGRLAICVFSSTGDNLVFYRVPDSTGIEIEWSAIGP
ncbi:MAG: hypothetical protein KDN22_04420, partial [Verrucomicrobiae bacterium]|nr:hypothetical protein [Verrucomicrobiae bacterium]